MTEKEAGRQEHKKDMQKAERQRWKQADKKTDIDFKQTGRVTEVQADRKEG